MPSPTSARSASLPCSTTRDRPNDQITDYAGLWNTHPVLASLMTVFLLSLGGFPPMAGFIAKWYVFSAAVKAGDTGLAIIGVLTSVISVFFYLRIVVMMYMTATDGAGEVPAGAEDRRRGADRLGDPHLLSRHPSDPRPRMGRGLDFDDLLARGATIAPPWCARTPTLAVL